MLEQVNLILKQAAERITATVAEFLPRLLALAVVLLVAVAAAWIARAMVRRSLQRVAFDKMTERWGLAEAAEWSPQRSPSLLVARLAYWMIILVGLLIGVSALDPSMTSMLVVRLLSYLPNLLAAALILAVGAVFARFAARGVLISAVNMHIQWARLLSLGVKWLVLVLAGAMAMEHLSIGGRIVDLAFGILFGGIVLALALAVGLGSKDMVSRSLERQTDRKEEPVDDATRFHHL